LFPAVAFSALFCGVGPAALATVLGLLSVSFWFLTPTHSLSVPDLPQLAGMFAFLAVSSIVVVYR
jgi:K+-sensing histidine kinase KdpD